MYFTHASSIFWTAAGHDCARVGSSTSAARRKSNDATVNSRDTSSDEGALQNTYGASREDAVANTAYPGWRPFRHYMLALPKKREQRAHWQHALEVDDEVKLGRSHHRLTYPVSFRPRWNAGKKAYRCHATCY
jgi:hypothetical protein